MLIGALIGAFAFLMLSQGVHRPTARGAFVVLFSDVASGLILGALIEAGLERLL